MPDTAINPNHASRSPAQPILESIADAIGHTPMVKIRPLAGCETTLWDSNIEVVAKWEKGNPAGSIKDRPASAMINALLTSPEFGQDTVLIDASSGNNGVALAWLCAIHKIPLTIYMPEHMSVERRKLMQLYGTKVVLTAKEQGTKGAIEAAKAAVLANPHALMLDQFANLNNPDAHAKTTAMEILDSCGGTLDAIVLGVGTGGTLTGLSRALKHTCPDLIVVAVEPQSCPVLSEGKSGVHGIQGLSSGHIPDVLETDLIDQIITVADKDAIHTAKCLAREQGLAVGISSGAAAHACFQLASQWRAAGQLKNAHHNIRRQDSQPKRILTIFADGAERYFSTALFDD